MPNVNLVVAEALNGMDLCLTRRKTRWRGACSLAERNKRLSFPENERGVVSSRR